MSIESLLKRDRRIVLVSIAALTALAWIYLLRLAGDMKMTAAMPKMPDVPDMAPMLHAWSATDFAFIFVMWAVMMVGMMTPSAAPMLLIYAPVARQSAINGQPLASTGWFATGYLFSWTAFSLVASAAQGVLERVAWLTPMMAAASHRIGGLVLVVAGVYQFSMLKYSCLAHCQSPFCVHTGSWWLQTRTIECAPARVSARHILRRLLLGADAASFCSWRDEHFLDRGNCCFRAY
jgi:predicted metal-binding membrane protein